MIALPPWFEQLARNVGIVAAFIVALGVIVVKTRLGNVVAWMWKRLVGQPVTDWLKAGVHEVVDPMLSEFSARNDQQHRDNLNLIHGIENRVAGIEANTKAMDGRLVHIEDHITKENPIT